MPRRCNVGVDLELALNAEAFAPRRKSDPTVGLSSLVLNPFGTPHHSVLFGSNLLD